MNKLQVQFRISVTLIISVIFLTAISGQEKIVKEIHESYTINKNTNLSADNKFGNIDIVNWDKDLIDITVQIKVYNDNTKWIQEVLDAISISYGIEDNHIYFETKIDESFNNNIFKSNEGKNKFEINYRIKMPDNVPVNISNKYGNLYVEKLTAPSTLEVKYGNLKADDIKSESKEPMSEVILSYSDGNIEACSWLKISCKYSKIRIDDSKALIFITKYSKVFVDRGSSIVTEARYDDYEIGTIANFVTEAEYCNFRFKSIGKKLQVDTKYSDVKVGFMPASFELIKISNKYGGYKIGLEDDASYKIKGHAKYGDIDYPRNGNVNRFQENNELNIEGMVGSNSNSKSQVIIETKYGSVKLAE